MSERPATIRILDDENLAPPDVDREISEAQKAKTVLESDAFRRSIERVQKQIFDDFTETDPTDEKKLVFLRVKQNALAELVRDLKSTYETGLLAIAQKEEEETKARAEEAARAGDSARVKSIRGIG